MKLLAIIIGLFLGAAFSQKKLDIDFIGTWTVKDVNIDQTNKMMKNPGMINMFKASMSRMAFTFKPDHRVTVTGGNMQQRNQDAEWTYDPAYKLLQIKGPATTDQYVLYLLVSKDAKGQVFFKMQNAPVTLKMKKQ
ncbi:hypothetical protein [Mucilaginibacter ginkgonis]|uniref:Lipocalin-like protein n=1 Tax=Mucilaginibacter ginkgonis TaxID=2682091 RepID=A0A6I4I2M1_9SPHI|nr:hypothetical protein [Mucilaginibacter ginkgonis]QQL50724.1 hypothetical protein GO620_004495 [Mucilaginibacter ginkgonis]